MIGLWLGKEQKEVARVDEVLRCGVVGCWEVGGVERESDAVGAGLGFGVWGSGFKGRGQDSGFGV